jgi:hypothetical protein
MTTAKNIRRKIQRRNKMNNQRGIPVLAQGLLPGVKANDLKNVTCKNCGVEGNGNFIKVLTLRYASTLQTTVGRGILVDFPVGYACTKCGKLNEFDIKGVTDKKEVSEEVPKEKLN